jgi:adenylate cyclase
MAGLHAAGRGRLLYYFSHSALARTLPAAPPPDERVVLVKLDDETLDDPRLAQWAPGILRRREHARLVRQLRAGGARVIGFDIQFIGESEDDAEFRAALDGVPSAVLAVETRPRSVGERIEEPAPLLASAPSVRLASPTVRQFAATSEVMGVEMEQPRPDGRVLNALSFECWKAAADRDDVAASRSYGRVGPNEMMIIRWFRQPPEEVFPTISYRAVWDGSWQRSRPDLFRDRIVLVGSYATTGKADTLKTPVGPLPGVAVHACALKTLLDRAWVREEAAWATWLLATALAGGVAVAVLYLRPWGGLLALVAALAVGAAISVAAFQARVWLGLIEPALAVGLTATFGFVARAAAARVSLERFAGAEAARELERGGIHTRTQQATILFADVRGYTTLSESLSPAELMDVLNAHFRWVDGIIARHGGRVDKHIGDALMAVFEGTRAGRGHAERALRAAAEIVRTADARSGPAAEIDFGIGLHTGEISTGLLGDSRKQEYGSIGDAVNVAARLQQATRDLDVRLLVSEDTHRAAGETLPLRALEPLLLKGKSEPIGAYTLADA